MLEGCGGRVRFLQKTSLVSLIGFSFIGASRLYARSPRPGGDADQEDADQEDADQKNAYQENADQEDQEDARRCYCEYCLPFAWN